MTKNPISNISYNTKEFLLEKMELLVTAHKIQTYQFIQHKGEQGLKDHIHLRIVPNKSIDPMEISEMLEEYVEGEEKPRGVVDWHPSKEEDWTLYVVHDEKYLKQKYGSEYEKSDGKIAYDYKEITVGKYCDLDQMYIRAQQYFKNSQASIIKELRDGTKMSTLIETGRNVFTVNACMKTLQLTEFEKTVELKKHYEYEYKKLYYAIKNCGLMEIMKEDKEKDIYYFLASDIARKFSK